MPTLSRLALRLGCCAAAVAATWLVWHGTQSRPNVVRRNTANAADEREETRAPDLALVDVVRTLTANSESELNADDWLMEGTIHGSITLPGRFTLKWREGEVSERASDIAVIVNEAGGFVLRAPLASWRPFASYPFVVSDSAGEAQLEGWCVLEHTLVLKIPPGVHLGGRILEPGGEKGAFDYAIRTASPSGGAVFLARGATDDAGAFRQRVKDGSLLRGVYLSARSERTGRLYLFHTDPEELLRGDARFECRDVVAQVSIVNHKGLRPDGLVVRAALVDALQNHLALGVTYDQATANSEVVCANSGLLEVTATAPGYRPVIARHRVAADAPAYLHLGQLVLAPESVQADLCGEVVDEAGQPVLRANVIVIPYGWSLEPAAELAKTALVDENGGFAIAVDRSGQFTVIVQHPRFPNFTLSEGPVTVDGLHRFTMPSVGAIKIEPMATAALGAAHWSGPISYVITSLDGGGGAAIGLKGDLWSLSQALPLPAGRHAIHRV